MVRTWKYLSMENITYCVSRRLRKFPHHETLGSRIIEGTDLEPTWRNNLRLVDLPWVGDHKVKDDIVFPFAAYVAMAGAAISQLTGSTDFTLRRITVKAALVLRESESVEISTTLRPLRLTDSLDSSWYEFRIASNNGDIWTKHCLGQIRGGSEFPISPQKVRKFLRPVSSPYSLMTSLGLNYGNLFRRLGSVSAAPGEKTAAAVIREDQQTKAGYALHPSTIDCCFQLCLLALSEGVSRRLTQLCVPTGIQELYIAPGETSELHVEAFMGGISNKDTPGTAFAVSNNGNVVLSFKGLKVSSLESNEETKKPGATILVFKPHVDFQKVDQLIQSYEPPDRKGFLTLVEKLSTLCVIELHYRSVSPLPTLPHLSKYQDWMHLQTKMAQTGTQSIHTDIESWTQMPSHERVAMIEASYAKSLNTILAPAADLIYRIFCNYNDIMKGNIEPLEVLIRDEGLTKVYDAIGMFSEYKRFAAALGHENPTLRILEIGAGTGGTSAPIIQALTLPDGSRLYSQYT